MANPVHFYPMTSHEYNQTHQKGSNPYHLTYACGACGKGTNGRVVATCARKDGTTVAWAICSCEREEPSVLVLLADGTIADQIPVAREFHPGANWPLSLTNLFEEASRSFSAGAYTSATMACRKLLMVCACLEGADDGKPFTYYVDYVTNGVLNFPKAKTAIDKIRGIGNEANHSVAFVSKEDAHAALSIVSYMLNTLYSLPSA